MVSECESKKGKKKKKKPKTGTAERKSKKHEDEKLSGEPPEAAVEIEKDPTISAVAEITDEVADEEPVRDEETCVTLPENETREEQRDEEEEVVATAVPEEDEESQGTDQSKTPTPGTVKSETPPSFSPTESTKGRRTLLVPSKTAPVAVGLSTARKTMAMEGERKSQTDSALPKVNIPIAVCPYVW